MIALAALALMQASPAEPVCIRRADPPAGLEAWKTVVWRTPTSPPVPLTVGHFGLPMQHVEEVRFDVQPAKSPAAGSYAIVLPLDVKKAGIYRLALSAPAWLDVVRGGKVLESVAHTHGPPCTGIRKIVDFDLKPGSYTVQISGAKEPSATMLVAPKK